MEWLGENVFQPVTALHFTKSRWLNRKLMIKVYRPTAFPRNMTQATIADIQLLLGCKPFLPFVIVTRSGQKYRIASPDHAGINPRGSRLHVWFDDDTGVTIAEANIVALEKDAQPATA